MLETQITTNENTNTGGDFKVGFDKIDDWAQLAIENGRFGCSG